MSSLISIWNNRKSLIANFRGHLHEHGLLPALRYQRHIVSERLHERRYGIDTRGRIDLSLQGYNASYVSHHPTPYKALKIIFRCLPYECGDRDVLVDFGSGAGRSTLVACKVHQFRRAYGVELLPSLVQRAENNLGRIRTKLACKDIQFKQSDALDFTLPDDTTVCFFFNPFKGEVLEKVFDKIRVSIAASPRPILIAYLNPMAEAPSWMKRVAKIETYPFECHVYRASPA